jgi:hypothetical protein
MQPQVDVGSHTTSGSACVVQEAWQGPGPHSSSELAQPFVPVHSRSQRPVPHWICASRHEPELVQATPQA